MPIYEYRCESCGYKNEYLQRVSDPLLTECPECHKPTFTKLVSVAGFQLKGTGWYATDFKTKPAKPQADKESGSDKSAETKKEDAGKTADKPAETKKGDTKSEASGTGACPATS